MTQTEDEREVQKEKEKEDEEKMKDSAKENVTIQKHERITDEN